MTTPETRAPLNPGWADFATIIGVMFFDDRRDTKDIANLLGLPESEVYNALDVFRLQRKRKGTP